MNIFAIRPLTNVEASETVTTVLPFVSPPVISRNAVAVIAVIQARSRKQYPRGSACDLERRRADTRASNCPALVPQ